MTFTITLNGQSDFSKCIGLAIRGFNKIKMYSTLYSHIKDCNAFDPVFIKPKTVIDAVGKPDPDRGIEECSDFETKKIKAREVLSQDKTVIRCQFIFLT